NNHTFTLGFEFEQRIQTYYSVSGTGLWNVGRGLLNRHLNLGAIDTSTAKFVGMGPDSIPIYDFDFVYQTDADGNITNQSQFDKNVRKILGVGPGVEVDIDQLTQDQVNQLNVNMFSAGELLDNGVVSYQGYTHDGKRSTKKTEFADYFRADNEATRPQDAFRPIYMAGFIEDKFAIDDLILRLGVRVDRYDANQMVLKDKYAMVDLETVGELGDRFKTFANAEGLPTPQADWVVYVDQDPLTAPSDGNLSAFTVTGYRSGDTFYNAQGEVVENPLEVRSSGGYFPFFTRSSNPTFIEARKLSLEAFKDYEPQIIVAPRLSFSFPISEDALFFAHYDMMAQRPEQIATNPSDYYYLNGQVNNLISNGTLKPQKKIDYQVGFQQRLTQSSGLTLKAFYSDYRDLIQVRQIVASYPQSPYLTFDNLDYGTVKGLTIEYDLRRTANLTMGASYTLQFAQGTGSGATSGFDLAQAGGQVRTLIPLDYDQRHALKLNMDYRFRDGEGIIGGHPILQNTGINFNIYAGSGTPYSRASNPTTTADFTVNERNFLAGSPNGSRLPGNVRAGLRIDKDFKLPVAKDSKKAPKVINVYYRVQNLFNQQNVLGVYRFTGSPTDDAFISERFIPREGNINDLSFVDLYMIKLQNPGNFSLPRRSYIGVTFNF
ncbi:MAG: TonB-dependent receptor, partial [Sphingobacteriales bacterium]